MASAIFQSLFHPSEVAALIRFKLFVPTNPDTNYTSPLQIPYSVKDVDNYSYAMCYYFLNLTSRSFARVIQELNPELRHPICIFYLVLRGLDTVEDDMSIPYQEEKRDMLLDFYTKLSPDHEDWSYNGNSDTEKDKPLLVDFHYVIKEFNKLKPAYRNVIIDITRRMGQGMAEFRDPQRTVDTIGDYNSYCHYVAGLVGIGLTSIFVNSGLEKDPKLVLATERRVGKEIIIQDVEYLPNRMGLFLQKVNILKDFMPDMRQGRVWWPKEIWKMYVPESEISKGIAYLSDPENKKAAMACLNHLVADALELVPDCLEYLSLIKEPSVFRFCAIPQVMAMASLTLFFNNSALFESEKPVKIRRGTSAKLILNCCNDIDSIKRTYQQYVYELHRKNHDGVGKNDLDKSFIRVAIVLGNIQRWLNIHTMHQFNNGTVEGVERGTRRALELSEPMKRSWIDVGLMAVVLAATVYFFDPTIFTKFFS